MSSKRGKTFHYSSAEFHNLLPHLVTGQVTICLDGRSSTPSCLHAGFSFTGTRAKLRSSPLFHLRLSSNLPKSGYIRLARGHQVPLFPFFFLLGFRNKKRKNPSPELHRFLPVFVLLLEYFQDKRQIILPSTLWQGWETPRRVDGEDEKNLFLP